MSSSSAGQYKQDWDEMTAEAGVRSSAKPSTGGKRSGDIARKALWVLAILPILASGLLASLVFRARFVNGQWPSLDNPDPKVFGLHYNVALIGFVAAFASVLLVPIIGLSAFALGHRRITIRPTVVAFVSFALYFFFVRLDLGGIGTWFAD